MREGRQQLLTLLSDGCFHSGGDIGEVLGVSRTAIWKYVRRLSDLGLEIESIKGKGYRLLGGMELLDSCLIDNSLSAPAKECLERYDLIDQVDSTNQVAAEYPIGVPGKGYACLAEYQSAGRGRRGRRWISPYGSNIYLSIAWQFDDGMGALEGLSLAVGAVVAEVLVAQGIEEVGVKWPNDVLVDGCKLAGVLVEASGDPLGLCKVVIGVGVNFNMSKSTPIDQPWASVLDFAPHASRNHIAAELMNQLVALLETFPVRQFVGYQQDWCDKDVFRGEWVRVSSGEKIIEGIASGVSHTGALLLEVDGVLHQIHGGEVSLRSLSAS